MSGALPISRAPLTLTGPVLWIARAVWVAIAAFGVFVNIATLPIYYHRALTLHYHDFGPTASPAVWRTGLHALGLTPAQFAGISLGSLVVLSSALLLIGLLIFLRKSNEWISLLISLELVSFGMVANNTAPVGWPHWFLAMADAYNNIAYLSFFMIPLVFPDGRFVPRWSGWVLAFAIPAGIGGSIFPHTVLDSSTWPAAISIPLGILLVVTIFGSPIYRYVRVSSSVQREQTKWVMFTLVLAIGLFLLLGSVVTPAVGSGDNPVRVVVVHFITNTIVGIAFLLIPVGFAIAILRYRLWNIDVIINRTLVYGSLSMSLGALYIGGVIALQAIFRTVTGQSSDLAIAIATLAVAALFNPWRRRVQSFIDQRFYRRKYNATRILATFNARLRDEVDLEQLTGNLLAVTHDTMQPAGVGLWLRGTEGES